MTLERNWECQCPAGMEKFGDSCILNTDWNEFFNSNEDKQISKMFYFDAESARGVKVTEPII